jgi:hypothetical protein
MTTNGSTIMRIQKTTLHDPLEPELSPQRLGRDLRFGSEKRRAAGYFARVHAATAVPPPEKAGTVYFSSSPANSKLRF